jgi:hypothetical protein
LVDGRTWPRRRQVGLRGRVTGKIVWHMGQPGEKGKKWAGPKEIVPFLNYPKIVKQVCIDLSKRWSSRGQKILDQICIKNQGRSRP